DWSARGESSPRGVRFLLEVPPGTAAGLELSVPPDHAVSAFGETALVSGPYATDGPDRHVYRLDFAGQGQVRFEVLRRSDAPGQSAPPLLVRSLESTYTVEPDYVRCVYRFDVDDPRLGLSTLVLDCDPSLRPYEVKVDNLRRWTVRPAPPSAGPGRSRT